MSLVFECEKSGLKNMDMDLIQYMIKCFEDYFPYCLNYILVIEMSWVLNGKQCFIYISKFVIQIYISIDNAHQKFAFIVIMIDFQSLKDLPTG